MKTSRFSEAQKAFTAPRIPRSVLTAACINGVSSQEDRRLVRPSGIGL